MSLVLTPKCKRKRPKKRLNLKQSRKMALKACGQICLLFFSVFFVADDFYFMFTSLYYYFLKILLRNISFDLITLGHRKDNSKRHFKRGAL